MAFDLVLEIRWLLSDSIFIQRINIKDIAITWENILFSINVVRYAYLLAGLELDSVDVLFKQISILVHVILVATSQRCLNFALIINSVNCSQPHGSDDSHLLLNILALREKYLREVVNQVVV